MGKWILLVVLFLLMLTGCSTCGVYNSMVSSKTQVEESWSNVETHYQRRMDLYTSIMKVIEGSGNFEKSTLIEVTQARASATQIKIDPTNITPEKLAQFQQAQSSFQSSFSRLLVSMEKYPDLKTTAQFAGLQSQIEGTENRINIARKNYNSKVSIYNQEIKSVPNVLFAGMFGFTPKPFYESEKGSEKPPDIKFNIK
jgi:LemA protein